MLLKMAGIASMLMRLVNIGLVFSFTILAAKYMGGGRVWKVFFFCFGSFFVNDAFYFGSICFCVARDS